MDLRGLSGKNAVIYDCLWKNKEFEFKTDENSNSIKIQSEKEKECEAIEEAFSISNKYVFKNKYEQAIDGDGNEKEKILSLHSSSRCSLLCFYNVEEKPITLEVDNKKITFNYSTFEFKNPVIGSPSNMDVVLISEDEKTVLFLESKFSEYYMSSGNISGFISNSYKEPYKDKKKKKHSVSIYDRLDELELKSTNCTQNYKDKNGKEHTRHGFKLKTIDNSLNYLDGIKQMISHYIGVRRRLDGDSLSEDTKNENKEKIYKKVLEIVRNSESAVYLGEILFDKFYLSNECKKDNLDDPKVILENYSKLYEKFANILNDEIQKSESEYKNRFKVLAKHINYSDVMKKNESQIDEKILKFYGIVE